MTYTLGVPFDGQSLSSSKPQIRTNFQLLFNDFAINHVAINSTGQGKHKFLQMPNQGSAPTTLANESGFYAAQSAAAFSNLFWKQESDGADPDTNQGAIIQLTNVLPQNLQQGASFLPGGLLIQWQIVSTNSTGAFSTNFPYLFKLAGVNTDPYVIILTPNAGQTNIAGMSQLGWDNYDVNTGTFNVKRVNGTGTFPVCAVGIGPRT